MVDMMDARVLSGTPWNCPFCNEKEAGLNQLTITMHCLGRHPVEYVLLKRLTAESANTDTRPNQSPLGKRRRNNTDEREADATWTSAEPTRRVVRAVSECDSSYPEPMNQTPEAVTDTMETMPVAEPTGPPAMNGMMVETDMPDGMVEEGWVTKEELPAATGTVTKMEMVKPKAESSVLPKRCVHNKMWCTSFPLCLGRICSFRHPDCPMENRKGCPASNECPFNHQSNEMTCSVCPGRTRPDPDKFPPMLIHCPHRKINKCKAGPQCHKTGVQCNETHAICRNRCKGKRRRACWFDHLDFPEFCSDCKKLSKVEKVIVSESGKVSPVTVILADWDASTLTQLDVDMMGPVIIVAKKGAQLGDIQYMGKLFRDQVAKEPIQRPKALLLALGGCDIFRTDKLPKMDKIPERMVLDAKKATYDLGIEEVRLLLPPLRFSLPPHFLEYSDHQFWANKHQNLSGQAMALGSKAAVRVIPSPIEPNPANFESDGSTLSRNAAVRHFSAGLAG